VDAFNFLDIKYASFTGLDWFDYQLIEGEWPLRRINNNNKKSITAWVELCNRQLNNKNNKTQHARFMRAFYCLLKPKMRSGNKQRTLCVFAGSL
jgi:hypothetical protein